MAHNARHVFLRVVKSMGDVTIREGKHVVVHQICVANGTGNGVTQEFTESAESGDVNNVIMTLTAPAGETISHGHEWHCEHGFRVKEPIDDVEVTVIYRNKE